MITEFTTRVQTPDEGFDWLYKDQEGEPRMFRHEVGLPPEAEPWGQCTDAEKVAWEEEHQEQEPTPEPSDNPEDEGYRFDQMPVEEAEDPSGLSAIIPETAQMGDQSR